MKKRVIKQFFVGFIMAAIIFSTIPIKAAIDEYICSKANYKVMINGTEFNASDYPILNYNGSTYAPFRAMLEAAGMSVNWNAQLGQASVTNNSTGTPGTTWGTYTFSDGSKYVGEFQNGEFHGQGTLTFANGSKYVGEWQNDKYHGQGTYTQSSGSKYVGEFQNGLRHGQGTLTFASGSKYVGKFQNGEFHGQGTLTFSDGSKYVGEWQNDLRHGQGTLTFSDGYTITGTWANGEHID